MRSFVAQDLTFLHPEKVNRLILYAATSVGKDAIAQKTEVVKVLSDFVAFFTKSLHNGDKIKKTQNHSS